FGVLLMVAFTLSAVPQFMAESSPSQNPLIATSRYGNFHAFDIGELLDKRNVVKQFLYNVLLQANLQEWFDQMQRQFGGDLHKLLGPQAFQRMEGRIGSQIEQMLMSMIGPTSERSVVQMRLQASLAQREGLVIDDDAIATYLRDQTNDRVTSDQMKAILQGISSRGKQRISKAFLFDALRDELAAMKYRELFFMGLQSTPAERWDYYTRTKRRATVELVAIPATDFLTEIKDPSQRELESFFDEYKEDEPVPGSPTPGFKVPHKAAFQYFKADYKKFFDEVTVTEKEIEEYYEKNKDTKYLYSSVPEDDETPDESAPSAEDKNAEDKEAADKKPDASKTETPSDAKATTPAKDAAPNESKESDTKSPENKDADKAEESSSSCGDDGQASADDATEEPASKTAEPESPTPPSPEAKKAEAETSPASDKPADAAPADSATPPEGATPSAPSLTAPGNAPSAEKAPPAEKAPTDAPPSTTTPPLGKELPKSPPPLIDRYQLPTDIHSGKNPKYAPLWRVHDDIRKELAGSRAVAKMDGILQKLREELSGYTRKLGKADYEKARDPKATVTMPKKPDFAALAKAAGIESGEIPLSPAYVVRNQPGLGQSMIGLDPFASFAYQSLKLSTAVPSQDSDGNRYMFWKTEDVPAHVPDLAKIRTEVEHAWKMIQAREPMDRKANELASQAREAKKTLKDTLGAKGYKVVESPAFSWLTSGSAGNFNSGVMPTISDVEGVIDPGSDFMREVFSLRVGDVGVAQNNPETIAYVLRPTSVEPSENVLRETFMADKGGTQTQIQQAALVDQRKLVDAWNKQLVKETSLVWVQPPNDSQGVE
ncbi:MAG TPA: hypothetical protein VHV77_15410, partial [Pirellulales bacterium]|nr:hypothetical protein [Pirellulales bacterium]